LFEKFVWLKQTSKYMNGAYPFPGSSLAQNCTETIAVFVKPGPRPRPRSAAIKAANRMTRALHRDLTQPVWFMVSADIGRRNGHPAPFPERLPARLIRLFTYGAADGFAGEAVLDPFVGTGTSCAVAKRMGRRYAGIDIDPEYVAIARARVEDAAEGAAPQLCVGHAKYPGAEARARLAAAELGSRGAAAAAKHKRKTYGRKAEAPASAAATAGDQP
jgi:DNA modification methylase